MRVWVAVGILLIACTPAPPAPVAPSQPVPVVAKAVPFTDAVITGRVLVNGQAVPELGLVQTRSWTSRRGASVTTVRQPGGSFKIHVPAGAWDLLIGGRGFAPTVLIGKTLRSGRVTDLGDIIPARGFTVSGQVTDAQAGPVAHATVTIRASLVDSEPVEDSIAARMNGDFVAIADASGHYQLDGVTALDLHNHLQIRARNSGTQASLPESLPVGNLVKDLVVHPTGWIDGTAAVVRSTPILVQSVVTKTMVLGARTTNDTFAVRDLPAGDYWIQVAGFPRKLVTVVANQPTAVQFP